MSDRNRSPSGEPGSEEEIPPVANYPQQAENTHSSSQIVNFCPVWHHAPGLEDFTLFKQLQDMCHSLEKDVAEAMSKLELLLGFQHEATAVVEELGEKISGVSTLVRSSIGLYEQHLGHWCQLQQRVSALEQKEKEHQQAREQIQLLRQQLAKNQELLRQQKIESQVDVKMDVQFQQMEQKLARLEEQLKETREQIHELGVQQQLQSHAQKVQHQKLESLTQLERQPLGSRNQQSGITQALAARKFEHLSTKDGVDKENYTPQKMPM